MIQKVTFLLFLALPLICFGQKKTMTPEVYKTWNRISDVNLSTNGEWSLYTVHPEKGNKSLYIHNNQDGNEYIFPRAESPTFDHNGETVIFKTKPDYESVRNLKRLKTPKKK